MSFLSLLSGQRPATARGVKICVINDLWEFPQSRREGDSVCRSASQIPCAELLIAERIRHQEAPILREPGSIGF